MKLLFKRIFNSLIDLKHILTPIAIEHLQTQYTQHTTKTYRLIYIFGIKVCYWSTIKFN